MAETYIKKEGGKEVVYEKGIFGDTKIGDLHENLSGTKATRNVFGTNVKVEEESFFSGERKATVGDQKGVFRKGIFDSNPTFKPEKDL